MPRIGAYELVVPRFRGKRKVEGKPSPGRYLWGRGEEIRTIWNKVLFNRFGSQSDSCLKNILAATRLDDSKIMHQAVWIIVGESDCYFFTSFRGDLLLVEFHHQLRLGNLMTLYKYLLDPLFQIEIPIPRNQESLKELPRKKDLLFLKISWIA